MNTVLCEFCLKSGILCPSCEDKVRRGEVSKLYVEVARFLLDAESRWPQLHSITLYDVVDGDGVMALVVNRGGIKTMLRLRPLLRELSRRFGRKVKVLEKDAGERRFIEDLFSPMEVVAINAIWLPDGSTETRVVLRGRRPVGFSDVEEALKKIAFKVRGLSLRVDFSR